MSEIAVGEKAPNFELPTDDGGLFRLSEHTGTAVVLYFYPKDDTPGCTAEAIAFTAMEEDFRSAGAIVVGISPDSVKSHGKFKAKHKLSVLLAADSEKSVVSSFGVWVQKSRYGREYMGVERSTFLIDRKGNIVGIWRKVKVDGHAAAILEAVKELS